VVKQRGVGGVCCVYIFVCVLYMYLTGELDREDTLIYSLGLGSTGHDYSIVTEPIPQGPVSPPTSASNTTRRRRQTIEYRCPHLGTNGYICDHLGIYAPIHIMTIVSFSRCTLQKFRQSLSFMA